MKSFFYVLAIVWAALLVHASNPHDGVSHFARHARLSRSETSLTRAAPKKKCPNRVRPSKAAAPSASSTAKKTDNKSNQAKAQSLVPPTLGVINVKSTCGPTGASRETTHTTGPNGNIDWLNCGLNDGGWKPPHVEISDLITVDLHKALAMPNTPFKACSKYIGLFEKYGNQFGIPPIMVASFALQESTCNPETVGGGGEQGLMQITKDKCRNAPGGNCREPDYNIRTGTAYFKSILDAHGGNVVATVGAYNGWFNGITYGKATAARHSKCCLCQNNLDYLQQYFNGWILGIDAYRNGLGKYFNLQPCRE